MLKTYTTDKGSRTTNILIDHIHILPAAYFLAHPLKLVQTSLKVKRSGGYAVSAGGKTQLRLFNAAGDGAFGETLAEVPGTALSVTEYAPDKDSLEIYLLCEADGMRRIHVYDALKKTQRTLPGEFGCSEIVMAK